MNLSVKKKNVPKVVANCISKQKNYFNFRKLCYTSNAYDYTRNVNRAKRKRLEQKDNEDYISSTTSSSNIEGSSSECSLLRGRWA